MIRPKQSYPLYTDRLIIRLLLAFVGGFCTTATYIRYHILGAWMTGNVTLLITAIAQHALPRDYMRLLFVPLFMVTAVASTLLYKAQHNRLIRTATILQLMAATIAIVSLFYPHHFTTASIDFVITALLVVALSIQNTITAYTRAPQTTAVTTLWLTLLILSSEKFVLGNKANIVPPSSGDLVALSAVLLCFITGSAVSALLTMRIGYCSLVVPALLMLIIVILAGNLPTARHYPAQVN